MSCVSRPRAGGNFSFFPGILFLAGVLLVSGCTLRGGGGGGGFGGAPTIGTEPVTGEVIGSGSIKVGLLLPLSATGNAGTIAAHMKNAAALAMRDFPNAGIQLLVKDDRGTPDGARAAATEAINQGAELVLGPLFAQSVTAAAQVTKAANVPIIAFSTDRGVASRGVFLLSFLPQSDVDRVVQFAAQRGKRAIAALLPNNGYGTVVEAALQRAVAARGSRLVLLDRYELDRASMQAKGEALAEVIKKNQADSVFMPDAGDAVPFIVQVIASQGVAPGSVQYLGSGQWNSDPRFTRESNLAGGWYPAPDNAGFEAFAAKYRAAFGDTPLRQASLGYDATSLAAGLASRFGAERFRVETIANPNGFAGVDGAFRLLQDGTNQRALAVYEIDRGSAKIVDAAPKDFAAGL